MSLVAAAGAAWAAALGVACLMAGMWLDLMFDLAPQWRIVAWAAAAGLALLCFIVACVDLVWRRIGLAALAGRLDTAAGTQGQIRSGVDLLDERGTWSPLTAGLAELAVQRAGTLAAQVRASRAVPMRPMAWAAMSVVAIGLTLGIVAKASPRMAHTQWLRFTDPFGDHPPYSPNTFAVEPGDTKVIYGSGQDVVVHVDGPALDRLDLVLRSEAGDEEVLPMFGEPGGVWRATIAGVTAPLQYHVRTRGGRSHRHAIGVITVPKIEQVLFRIAPPAYTSRGAYQGPLPQGGVAGLPGTEVEIRVRSNRPLSRGVLRLMPRQDSLAQGDKYKSLPMATTADAGNEVVGRFEIDEPGRIEIKVVDAAGQESQDSFLTSVAVLPDERPFVRLLDPPNVSLATPDTLVPVAMSAEDDYGISRLALYRSLNDSRALPLAMPMPAPAPTRKDETSALPLSTYGLHPGDEIKLYARVEDNDPAGAKGSESPLAVLRIISQEDYERLVLTREGLEVLQSKYQQALRRLENVAAEIEELQKQLATQPADSPMAEESRKKLAELAARMQREANEIRKSAEHKLPFDIDENFTKELAKIADMLDEAAKEVDAAAAKEPPPTAAEAREALEVIATFCKGGKKQYQENTTEPLDYLAKVYPLLEDQSRFTTLYVRQRELADRLESLKGKDGGDDPRIKARMRDLEAEQYQVREDLRQLLQDIEDHVTQLPENDEVETLRETASQFVRGVRDSGAIEAMSDAEAGLASFSGTRGYEQARKAEQILSEFMGKCKGMGDKAGQCLKFLPSLAENLGSTIDQLLTGAGISMGSTGIGSGSGGYSVRSSTLENVGLYGQLPALGGDLGGPEGHNARALSATRGHEGNFQGGDPGRVDPAGTLQATGEAARIVPEQYRERVGAYFERVNDEVGEEKHR